MSMMLLPLYQFHLLLCVTVAVAPVVVNNDFTAPQTLPAEEFAESLIGQNIPTIKMMKRLLRNFRSGRTASITMVFQAGTPVDIRWFRLDPSLSSRGSEVPNMLPISPTSGSFVISDMKSGEVIASTVTILNFEETFPVDVEILISAQDGSQQYQLRTLVKKATNYQVDLIDSPAWLIVPPPERSFRRGDKLVTHCKAFVPNEKKGFTNELIQYRVMPKINEDSNPRMEFQNLLNVHKDTTNGAERHGDDKIILLQGERLELNRGHVTYSVKARVNNANSSHQGIYQCAIERQFDKAYFDSTITMEGGMSLFPEKPPAVELISCSKNKAYFRDRFSLTLRSKSETCIRCRGFGHPRPKVAVYKGAVELTPNGRITVFKYVNVADAGVAEATYLIRNPDFGLNGRYSCKATNDKGSKQILFHLKFK